MLKHLMFKKHNIWKLRCFSNPAINIYLDDLYGAESSQWMAFEEDEEKNSEGAQDMAIKVVNIDYYGKGSGNRRNTDASESQFVCETGFETIRECPLLREFEDHRRKDDKPTPVRNFLRVHFGRNVPDLIVKKVLQSRVWKNYSFYSYFLENFKNFVIFTKKIINLVNF